MRVLSLLCLLVLTAHGDVADDLKKAFGRDGTELDQVDAIEAAAGVADPAVIRLVAKGLRSRDTAVRAAAIDALGKTSHPDALKELHALYWRDKDLGKNDVLFALLLKSIGRHGEESSIRVLADHPFRHLTVESGTARIMGLGNIRDKRSVEELLKAARKAGGRRRGAQSGLRDTFREPFLAALQILTGEDHGQTAAEWDQWWRAHRAKLKIDPKRPNVPGDVSAYWEGYWGERYYEKGAEPARPRLGAPFTPVKNPSPNQVKTAEAALKEAFSGKDDAAIIAAIEEHAAIWDARVVRRIARGLWWPDRGVRLTAARMLGWMKHPEGLKQLHRFYRRNKDLSKQEELFATVLKAIGRHGDKSSITVLKADPFKNLTEWSGRARILGLGNIRTKESVETLIKGMRLAGGTRNRGRRETHPRFLREFRLALAVLTGEDRGESKAAWEEWWRENKRTFRISATRPSIAEPLQKKWEGYWNEPY